MTTSAPPRRFKPEPVETSVKSSRKPAEPSEEPAPKAPRKFAPQPVETTARSSRKFAPELVETTQHTRRKFAPEPVETTVKSSKDKDATEPSSGTRRRFNPQPVGTSTSSNRKKGFDENDFLQSSASSAGTSGSSESSEQGEKRPRRRFAPQLIETAKRTRKAGDTAPAILPSDKTEACPGDSAHSPRRTRFKTTPGPPENTPTSPFGHTPNFLEIRRSNSPYNRRSLSRGSNRSQHSFRVPDLEPIESSGSEEEESAPPSLSTSPSNDSDHSYMYKEATRMRESVDDRFSGYLLELASRAAEKQLREQAMAAFPNSDFHEPVDHFIDRDSDESEVGTEIYPSDDRGSAYHRRDSSFSKINWEVVSMQQHREKQEKEAQKKQETEKPTTQKRDPFSAWGNPAADIFSNSSANKNIIGGWQKDGELDKMRSGARPPMLGSDIKFPRCASPDPARFDPTQGSLSVRHAMCYLTEQSNAADEGGLWHGQKTPNSQRSFRSNATSRAPSASGGLWGGHCVAGEQSPARGPTGLMTPMVELENPFESSIKAVEHGLPPSPPPSNADMASIDDRLAKEASMEDEFGNDFVTQVYNYLSLGYPSIARGFDEELAKISRIPIPDLRQDDNLAQSRGYIRLGEDGNLKDAEITEESCMRWRALRLYIREWVRQQPRMAADGDKAPGGMIGTSVRRGSWAW